MTYLEEKRGATPHQIMAAMREAGYNVDEMLWVSASTNDCDNVGPSCDGRKCSDSDPADCDGD